MKKSMIEVAYQVLTNNNGSMPFVDLWKDVSQEMGTGCDLKSMWAWSI